MAKTTVQKVYDYLLKRPEGMLARHLREAMGLSFDELNHAGDRLKLYGAIRKTKQDARNWRWYAIEGVDVSDKRGNIGRPKSDLSRRAQREQRALLRSTENARRLEMLEREAKMPLMERIKHPLDIAWAAFKRQMLTDRRE